MDRNKDKSIPGQRGPKSKLAQQPPDMFIALGAKTSNIRDVESKRTAVSILPKSTISSPIPSDRKRDTPPSSHSSIPPAKKIKVLGRATASTSSGITAMLASDRSATSSVEPWEASAIDCDAADLVNNILDCAKTNNTEKAIGYLLGGIRTFRNTQRFKPCKVTYSTLLILCQVRPSIFTNDLVVTALISSLKRELGGVKNKSNMYNQIVFINLLLFAFGEIPKWPDVFIKLYVEDAVTERLWIDNPYCKPFVENIVTAFNTKQPPRSLLTTDTWISTGRDTGSPLTISNNEEDDAMNEHKSIVETWNIPSFPRYTHIPEVVEQIVLEVIQEQLARRQQPETTNKNFIRFLSTACGLVEIRIIAVSRVETWLHNHKLMKAAQELLAYLCYNCSANTQRDLEVVVQLSKLRLKNKQMINFFNNCLKEMVMAFPENLFPLLKYTIFNELSNARNTNNLFVVGAMFQVAPEASADAFADICLELLMNKDDYLRSLRALLKEINRVLRHDFNLLSIVHSLLKERKDLANAIRDSEVRERIFLSLADLVCMCMLLSVSPQVRDACSQSKRDVTIIQTFQTQVSNIQREAVTWLYERAFKTYHPPPADYHHVLLKVLFLEQAEHYYKVDSWPGENERNLFLRLASEVPLLQATLLRILLLGISKENPINPGDAIEIADQLIKRVSNISADGLPPLDMDKTEIIDFLFNLCSYNYPENITLPVGYSPPKLAISTLYWKCWMMLLILAAHNPEPFGNLAWTKYPTLRMFMEMCITNQFLYPPPSMLAGDGTDEFNQKEQQTLSLEKQSILEFETHLAAASTKVEITEQTSLLLPQLMELNPTNGPRRPPQQILDQLQNLNSTHRLGHLLCRSRHPDFLLEIMTRHGGTAHMPWLAELVHSSEGALAHLPVQCLCEYLLSTCPTEKLTKHTQLLTHLKKVVVGNDAQMACEILEYLLRRLTSLHASSRAPAIRGLTLILSPNEDIEVNSNAINKTHWLTHYMLKFPHLQSIRAMLIQFLRQAILIETNPVHVLNYISFLAVHGLDDSLPEFSELVLDLASLIMERSSIISYILPGDNCGTLKELISVFWVYLQKAKEPADNYYLTDSQENVVVCWANETQCTLPILIVHASIILLTFGPVENYEPFDGLLDLWFPQNEEHPKAYLLDMTEEAIMVPDWLKLRMIRSNVARLLDAAVEKLEAPQLVLFIQSFGIPVVSISKLLQYLDRVTLKDPKLVIDSVLDKNYMIQLVEVQNRRGAKGGDTFVKTLEMQNPIVPDLRNDFPVSSRKPLGKLHSTVIMEGTDFKRMFESLQRLFSPNVFNANLSKDISYLCKLLTSNNQNTAFKVIDYIDKIPTKDLAHVLSASKGIQPVLTCLYTKASPTDSNKRLAERILLILNQKHPLRTLLEKLLVQKDAMEVDSVTSGTSKVSVMENSRDLAKKIGLKLINNEDVEKSGLLVDWLAAFELEIANTTDKKIQTDLLFSKNQLPFRPLLISALLQRASWKTLNDIIELLLLKENVSHQCATTVLDFLTALTKSPRLWQGRDKSIPKHHKNSDILYLDNDKMLAIVDYILDESKTISDWEKVMEKRLSLILLAIKDSKSSSLVVAKLMSLDKDQRAKELLLLLYMKLPKVGTYMRLDSCSDLTINGQSALDIISHTVLSALTVNIRIKDWTQKSKNYELCARKLAATHPNLVLRQLPMLAGCLHGRSLYEWSVMKSRSHFTLFGQICGLMELLEPAIFREVDSLNALLDSYMDLLKFHGHLKELTNLVNRLIVFLQNWMMHDLHNSLKYLQKHTEVFTNIENVHPSVRSLISSISLPIIQDNGNRNEHTFIATASLAKQSMPQNWQSLISGIQSVDPLNSLQEIEHLTKKRPNLLEQISQHLYNCMSSRNGQVRSVATKLVTRYLKHNPNASKEALPSILCCLNSKDGEIVESVMEKLPELVVVMQEYAETLLSRVYQLGIESNLNAHSNIAKCISNLSLQYGC